MKDALITNEKALDDYCKLLRVLLAKHGAIKVGAKSGKQRTLTQNASIHLYCTMLAEAFNEAGLDMQTVLAEGTSIPWSPEKAKDDIWKVVQLAITEKKSTTELETHEVSKVYDVINAHLINAFNVFVPFPDKEFKSK